MIYGYARVSTKKQQKEGNSLEDQRQKLLEAGCTEIVEEQYTGTTTHRPKFEELVTKLKKGDTLVVTKMDRFARTAADGSNLAKALLKEGVSLYILNMGKVEDTPIGRLLMNVLLSFAEFEKDMIVERTQAGREVARTKEGYKEGRPRKPKATTELAVKLINDGNSYKAVSEMTGLSESTILRRMREYRASHVIKPQEVEIQVMTKPERRIERPRNWEEVYQLIKAKKINQKDALKRLQLKKTTYYRLKDEYEAEIKGGAQR